MPVTGLVVDPDGRPAAGVAIFGSLSRNASRGWGQVVTEARTDEQGRFRLEIPADPARPGPKPGAIWAYQPGRLVASYAVLRGNVHGDVPLRLALGPPATTSVEVRDPGGKPVAGATIMPRVLNRGYLSVPDGLAARIAADTVTDVSGRATIAAFLPEEVSTVFVTAEGFGTQQFGFGHGQDIALGTKVVNLMPVGKVEGRIVGEPETVRGMALLVASWNTRSNPPPPPALGAFFVTTDDEGRFVLPEVPVGDLSVSGGKEGDRLLVSSPAGLKIEAGETTRVELKPTPGVRVHGVVREKGSGKPIPGVKIGDYSGGEVGESDASGRFTFSARPGRGLLQLRSTPAGYAGLMYGLADVKIPQDAAEFELPPIELARAGAVRGVVHDGRGRPVRGVTVAASWQVDEGPHRQGRREVSVTTDGRGAFSVADVPLGAAVTLSAIAPDAGRTARPVIARPGGEGEPVTLTLDPERLVAMKGRVVDTLSEPVAGARVHLRRQERYETGQVKGDVPVDFAGPYVLRTDAEGRFETPRRLDAEGEYAAIAEADDFVPGQTPWTRAADRTFPDLALRIRPERLVKVATREGLVRDGSSRPVIGATAWASFPGGPVSPEKVTTDAEGRFQLIGLPRTGALVLVEAEGFRFRGAVAGPDDSPVKLTLTRIEEPAAGMTTLPAPLPRADELALARGVIGPFAERVLKEKEDDDSTMLRTLTVLAAVDPARVLEVIAARPFKEGWFNDRLRSDAALALLAESPDEALAVAESIELASMRSFAFAELCDRLPGDDRAGRLRLLDRALLAARGVPEPGHKVVGIARVAEHLIDLGETDRAVKLLREFEPVARQLPTKGWDAFARGNFAEELAQIDPAAALELIEGLGEGEAPEPDRHRLNIAQELAGRDPAAAERVLDGLKRPSSIVRHGPRIVHAMAPKDPARARRIADRLGNFPDDVRRLPFQHAYALGMMALALADSDKAAARALLVESHHELAGLAKEGKRGFQDTQDAAVVAAALLPVAERIDPGLVPECFWRAASWRGKAPATSRPKSMPDALLALLLARYDRTVARAILEPSVSGGLSRPGADAYDSLRAVAAVDPRRAVTLLDTVPDDPDAGLNPFRNPKNEARLSLAGALAARPEDRWDRAVEKLLHLWTVGREDIF
jgi:hypothetical protein